MEIESLPKDMVEAFLKTCDEHIEKFNYKTFESYGIGAIWVHSAIRKSFLLYLDIINKYIEQYPAAKSGDGQETQSRMMFFHPHPMKVATHMRAATRLFHLTPPLKVNLMRKAYAVWAKRQKAAANKSGHDIDIFAILARIDKHSGSVADLIYATVTPKEDAQMIRYAFTELMGEPVEFPSHDVWEREGRTIETIMPRIDELAGGRQAGGGEADAQGDEEEEEFFEDLLELPDEDPDWANILPAFEAAEQSVDGEGGQGSITKGVDQGEIEVDDNAAVGGSADTGRVQHKRRVKLDVDKAPQVSRKPANRTKHPRRKKKRKLTRAERRRQGFDDETDSADERFRAHHATQSNVDRMFRVGGNPPPQAEPISKEDESAIEKYTNEKERGHQQSFTYEEKTFLVRELRELQKTATTPFRKVNMYQIVQRGVEAGILSPTCGSVVDADDPYVKKAETWLRRFNTFARNLQPQ